MIAFLQANTLYFVYIGCALGVLLLFDALRQVRLSRKADLSERTKRLKMLSQERPTDDILSALRRPLDRQRWAQIPVLGALPSKMQQAGLKMRPVQFFLLCCGLSIVAFVIFSLTLGLLAAAAVSLALGVALPLVAIEHIRKKRVAAFAAQLPEALELMSRGLSVGHPLNVSIGNVAKTMADPIGTEFGQLADQIAYGEALPDAFQELARRIDQEDMHYLAASVSIQHGTGGNLGAMLGTLAKVIRARYGLRRKIKAISSEGRASAKLLSVLPIGMYVATSITSPEYYAGVSAEPMYTYMAIAVVGLMGANTLILRKLVNFRI